VSLEPATNKEARSLHHRVTMRALNLLLDRGVRCEREDVSDAAEAVLGVVRQAIRERFEALWKEPYEVDDHNHGLIAAEDAVLALFPEEHQPEERSKEGKP
jgi:hypothetical protein